MSEEISSNDTNLCTTEEAFEQFQAEEDEFITLSDILPPPSPEHNPVSELDDVPYDNEVVLPAYLEGLQQEASDASAPCIQDSDVNTTTVTEPDVGVSAKQSAKTSNQPALPIIYHEKPRRGRKKRESTAPISQTVDANNVVVDSSNHENSNSTPGTVRPRRGRKPKKLSDESLNSSGYTDNSLNVVNSKKRGRGQPKINKGKIPQRDPHGREEIELTNSQNGLQAEVSNAQPELSDTSTKIIKKRPGRRRAQNIHTPTDVNNSTEDILHNKHDVSNLTTDSILDEFVGKVAKRSRKKKIFQKTESDDDDDEDNKSLSQIKKHGPNINGDDPISKVIPQELGVESQFIHNPHEQDEKLSTLLIETVGTNQMHFDNVDSEVVLESTDMEIDIVGTEETNFFPIIPKYENEKVEPTIEPDTKIELENKIDPENKIEPENEMENNIELKKENNCDENNLLVEDTTKRPIRRKARKTLQYDEGSDEDPFANVELSDDEPTYRKKGKKYYSDDEYVPGKKERYSSSELSDSDIDNLEGISKPKRKRGRMMSQNKSPRKKNQVVEDKKIKPDVATITPHTAAEDDIEECLQTSVIKAPDEFNQIKDKISHNSEFENFIAQKIQGTDLQIKKVSGLEPLQSAPLDIPILDPNEIKKTAESSTQTNSVKMETSGVQTSTPYDAPMKKNITLSAKQSEKACEFLKSVVKTTAELGQLMTQKSEDFIVKKINTDYVTDTLKMDYCIKKSFLLFKLAKHNLMQMEEDLSKQYEEFLKENNLASCREKPKEVVSKPKTPDSDSDCEIVEETKPSTSKKTSKFNPKTVFLNKELSIKIAKKPSAAVNKTSKKELNIKGPHSVWISDSVMVKKVKPTQSFLAQDSRNKKPPDTYITENMVSDFFEKYSQKQIQKTCAALTSVEWVAPFETSVYSYYFVKSDSFPDTTGNFSETDSSRVSEHDGSTSDVGNKLSLATATKIVDREDLGLESLSALCTRTLQKVLQDLNTNVHQPLIRNGHNIEKKILIENPENPKSLFQLCVNSLQGLNFHTVLNHSTSLSNGYNLNGSSIVLYNALSLKKLCSSKIIEMCSTSLVGTKQTFSVISSSYSENEDSMSSELISEDEDFTGDNAKTEVKTLFSLCVDWIQKHQQLDKIVHTFAKKNTEENAVKSFYPDYLKHMAFETVKFHLYKNSPPDIDYDLYLHKTVSNTTINYKVKRLADICFEIVSEFMNNENEEQCNESVKLTINSINTLSEEAFHNIDESCLNTLDNSQFLENDDTNYYDEDTFEDSNTNNFEEDSQTDECNWVSKLQMKELMSCLANERNMNESEIATSGEYPDNSEEQPMIARIKSEPEEEIADNVLEPAIVKMEPLHNLDEMTVIPDGVVTKQENEELSLVDPIGSGQENVRRGSFDMSTFEDFVRNNKMMHVGEMMPGDEIFSQSGLRVRRQYEPDSDNENIENDPNDLLVPQTFEPLTIENAKGHLMESSSDEESASKKATDKKKPDKRGKGRPKKSENKQQTTKEKPVTTILPNEVARLTKRMREKIRQEEKKVESSDSETEILPISKKKEKTKSKTDSNKVADEEIQCNNVDSTEQFEKVSPINNDFPGFSAVDQNEITSYQKYVKFVYDKIMPNDGEVNSKGSDTEINQAVSTSAEDAAPLIHPDEPVEMLECEPTMPIFDDQIVNTDQKKTRRSVNKQKTKEKTTPEGKVKDVLEGKNKQDTIEKPEGSTLPYTERNGWKCYPISTNETKLYQNVGIFLEKLPESFVETYFRYQNISVTRKEDEEVNRLINLNTLKRSGNVKDSKIKQKTKGRTNEEPGTNEGNENISDGSRAASPAASDRYDELTPSEDEANVDDEVPPPARRQGGGENNMAKDLLMGDSDSDAENKIKTEPNDESETPSDKSKKKKLSPKSKAVVKTTESPENLMLTADKMMNKELSLLHAPVVLDKDNALTSTPKGGPVTRQKHRGGSKHSKQGFEKNEDDSSSEEEKQWVSTKEKLLKRMGKKDSALEDDAKRAKLVTEFIERRGDDSQKRRRGRGRPRKLSSFALLEREKQLRVLSKEMMSEGDPRLHAAAKQSQSYFKGRRNIRKVIDKKSLHRSTVIANMEEFERKRRLTQRQARLREILGCEEGVNVVVMNGELCLEYDFEEQQSAVAVHPFFTRVMKAHQYEGVKFMWDACFESLEKVEAGHKGGGCILAHCMGLGKTLQVLALLHTVLTHPRVGIQRVLVCCPLSTVLNWVDEIHKWIGPVTDQIKVFELSKLKKTYERAYQLEDWYNGGGIFIIGYELFRSLSLLDPVLDDVRPTIVNKIRSALLDPGPDIVICDEGHLLKNDCSVLAVAMSRVQTKRRIVLTGTPMQNNLREYYCMVNFVKPNLLGTYSEYSNRFENPIMNGQHRDSREEDIKLMKQRTHILHKVLEGCLQRQEVSVLYPYLPKKHEYTVFIPLTQCQWDLYKHYMHNYANQSKQNVLKDFHILQKIWSHPQVLHNFLVRWREGKVKEAAASKVKPEKVEDDLAQEDLAASSAVEIKPDEAETWWLPYLDGGKMLDTLASSNKFVAVFRILDECTQLADKVLIFSTSLITMDSLEFFLKKINKWSLGQEYYRLDGSVPAEVRQKWCREFNAENNHKTKLFLISTRAGCLGLNMVAANRVIILDTSWNPAHDIQSIFRVYRFGQKKDCYIYRLVALGTMEQKIYERSVTKQAVACRVVDEQQIDRHYNMAELTELYKYDELGVSVAGGVALGVEDVALLRVARVAAVHAVHEHDSLLRGSSEQALEEHERNAAWMQFQQEQTHKQIQNHLTPMPPLVKQTYEPKREQSATPQLLQLLQHTEIKTEDQLTPTTLPPLSESKSKRGRKPKQQSLSIDDRTVHKIMNILIKHNYQQRQGPKEISELVASVRKIVAYGRVPSKMGLNQELTQSIADVLLGRDSPPRMAPLTDVDPTSFDNASRRKQQFDNLREPEEILPSTSFAPDPVDGRTRRRAALAAKKHIDSLTSHSVIDLEDDDWRGSDTDEAPETTELQQAEKPRPKSKKAQQNLVQTEKQLNSDINSILLSDEEDTSTRKSKKDKTVDSGEVVPLHPSLLSNKNFIKIVAHTYLEGNPMLDEDAATLAAQYSTLKALKEYESTGKKIDSGPIYDIAIKVLGRDILKKLNKSNPAVAPASAPSLPGADAPGEVKKEPPDSGRSSTGRVKPKGISELMARPPTAPSVTPPPEPPRRRGRPSRASTQAAQQPSPAAAAPPAQPVVPVGLIQMAAPSQPAQPMAPAHAAPQPQPFAPPAREESILPDDDVIFSQPIKTEAAPRKNSQPLILNSVLATKNLTPVVIRKNMTPQIQISSGNIVMPGASHTSTAPMNAQNMAPQTVNQDTICLDSDEEESITPNLPSKRVALKSTAKRPFPVTTTAFRADPQRGAAQSQHRAIPPNCIVIPAAGLQKLRKLPMGVVPVNQNQFNNQFQPNVMEQQGMMQQTYAPHNMNFATSMPPNFNMMGTQNQNVMNTQTFNYTQVPAQMPMMSAAQNMPMMNAPQSMTMISAAQSMPMMSPAQSMPMMNAAQNMPMMSTAQPMPLMTALPQMSAPQNSPQSILPTPTEPSPITPQQMSQLNKTVCKPGDILRITRSGQVEILNREEEPVIVGNPVKAAPATAIAKKSTTKPPIAKKNAPTTKPPSESKTTPTTKPPTARKNTPNNIVNLDDDEDYSIPAVKKTYKRTRKISSSSSSSSESSRASSPEREPDDPLSILKDVVHIRAADDEPSTTTKPQTPSKSQNISITKSTITPKPTSVKNDLTVTPSKDKVMSLINQTDSMLKQLSSVLSVDKKSSKSKVDTKSHKVVGSVDLTEMDTPSTSSSLNKLSRNITVVKAATKDRSSSTRLFKTSVLKKTVSSTSSGSPSATKVVGKSSNIILKNSGGKKQVVVMDERKQAVPSATIRAATAPPASKRPAPATAPPPSAKKKKNEPMTLKDFDLDDIDDIIELD